MVEYYCAANKARDEKLPVEEEDEITEAFLLRSASVGEPSWPISGVGAETWTLSIRGWDKLACGSKLDGVRGGGSESEDVTATTRKIIS